MGNLKEIAKDEHLKELQEYHESLDDKLVYLED